MRPSTVSWATSVFMDKIAAMLTMKKNTKNWLITTPMSTKTRIILVSCLQALDSVRMVLTATGRMIWEAMITAKK
jgi:hypothetical protein